jgi:hypothetical protein
MPVAEVVPVSRLLRTLAVAEVMPVARLLGMLTVADPTWLIMLLLRLPVFEEERGSVCEATTDPTELGSDPKVVEFGKTTDERIGADEACEGTQSC